MGRMLMVGLAALVSCVGCGGSDPPGSGVDAAADARTDADGDGQAGTVCTTESACDVGGGDLGLALVKYCQQSNTCGRRCAVCDTSIVSVPCHSIDQYKWQISCVSDCSKCPVKIDDVSVCPPSAPSCSAVTYAGSNFQGCKTPWDGPVGCNNTVGGNQLHPDNLCGTCTTSAGAPYAGPFCQISDTPPGNAGRYCVSDCSQCL